MRLTKASSSTPTAGKSARGANPAGNSRFTSRRRPGSLTQKRDPKKEALLQQLSSRLRDAGYTVRKEQLKRGHGWRAISGTWQALGEKLVFIDSRLNLDDQIAFLKGRIEHALEESGQSDLEERDDLEGKGESETEPQPHPEAPESTAV